MDSRAEVAYSTRDVKFLRVDVNHGLILRRDSRRPYMHSASMLLNLRRTNDLESRHRRGRGGLDV